MNYLQYYGLHDAPFSLTPDTEFFFVTGATVTR